MLLLSQNDRNQLERVQKSAFAIIYDNQHYSEILNKYECKTLEERRHDLCQKFAAKSSKHPIFSKWFNPKIKQVNTRSKTLFHEVPFKTNRWRDSPVPFMTSLLNKENRK